MGKGIYLCWNRPGYQSCLEHNRIEWLELTRKKLAPPTCKLLGTGK